MTLRDLLVINRDKDLERLQTDPNAYEQNYIAMLEIMIEQYLNRTVSGMVSVLHLVTQTMLVTADFADFANQTSIDQLDFTDVKHRDDPRVTEFTLINAIISAFNPSALSLGECLWYCLLLSNRMDIGLSVTIEQLQHG